MRVLRVIVLLPFLPLILAATALLVMCGLDVKLRKPEEEDDRKPRDEQRVAGDQEDDDWKRQWLIDMGFADGFNAVVNAQKDNTFEPSVSEQEWKASRKIRRLGEEAA